MHLPQDLSRRERPAAEAACEMLHPLIRHVMSEAKQKYPDDHDMQMGAACIATGMLVSGLLQSSPVRSRPAYHAGTLRDANEGVC